MKSTISFICVSLSRGSGLGIQGSGLDSLLSARGSRLAVGITAIYLLTSNSQLLAPSSQFDRQVLSIAPFLPRADVVAHAGIAEQPERQIRMRGAIAALAIGDHLAVGRDAGIFVHLFQFGGRLVVAIGGEVARPLDVNGARDRATSRGTNRGTAVLAVRTSVENRDLALVQPIGDGGVA